MSPQPWWKQAACKDTSYTVFFDDIDQRQGAIEKRKAEARAIAICHDCPVRRTCRDAALEEEKDQPEAYGVRGGWTAERRMHYTARRK